MALQTDIVKPGVRGSVFTSLALMVMALGSVISSLIFFQELFGRGESPRLMGLDRFLVPLFALLGLAFFSYAFVFAKISVSAAAGRRMDALKARLSVLPLFWAAAAESAMWANSLGRLHLVDAIVFLAVFLPVIVILLCRLEIGRGADLWLPYLVGVLSSLVSLLYLMNVLF